MKKILFIVLLFISAWSITNGMDLLWSQKVNGGISRLRYSSDGKFIYTIGGDGYLRKWDAPTGVQLEEMKIPIDSTFTCADISPDGKRLVALKKIVGNCDFYYWNTVDDTVKKITLIVHGHKPSETWQIYDSTRVLILNDNKTAFITFGMFSVGTKGNITGYWTETSRWDLDSLKSLDNSPHISSRLLDYAISKDDDVLISGLLLYKKGNFSDIKFPSSISAMCFDNNSENIYFSGYSSNIYRFNINENIIADSIPLHIPYYNGYPGNIRININSRMILYNYNSSLRIIDSRFGMIKETINIPSTDWLRIELCPDYLNFITYSTDGSIQCLSSNYFNSRLLESDFYLPKHEETTNSIVSFFDASSGNVKSWLWDFGDGSTSTERDPQHIYTKMGWYKVSLTIKDSVSQSVIAKDSIIHILDLDTAKTPNFNRIGEFNTQLSDIINLNFSSGSKELFAIPNAKNISIFDVVNNKIKNEIFLKEQFESIALSNDQKNILGFKSMNDIYYLDLKNDSVLFTKKIKNVADDAIVPVQIAFQTKEMQYSKSDVFMLPGDTSFICTYQYNYHLHTVSPPTNNYGEIVGASAYAFNIDPIMPMHLDTKNNITYQSAVYSARTRAFAISYKINTGKFCVKVVREDSTKTFTKQFPGDYAILLAFTNKSKQLVYTDNNNAVRMISIEDTNNTSLIAQNLTKPTAITVSNDDKYVIVGYEDGNIRLLDINAGVFVDSMKAPYAISNLVISDSGYLAVALVTGKVYIVKNTKFLEAAAIVSEQSVISDIIIYPNPCENQAKIEFNMNETGNVKIKLINFIGEDVKLIISKPIVKGCSFIEFNTSDLPIGIYFLQVQSGNNIQSIKFIKN